MRAVAYLYPWDLVGDDRAAARLRDLGIGEVALAAAYHAVRASTPRHPEHRIVELRESTLFVPPVAAGWPDAPEPPSHAPESAGAFAAAREALRAEGIEVRAWAALTHRDVPGVEPGRVVNAFGDVYSHALCPSSPRVRQYAGALTASLAAHTGVTGFVLEAVGQLGVSHASAHDKTGLPTWPQGRERLLDICLCAACRIELRSRGADDEELAARIRAAVNDDDPADGVETLGELAGVVLAIRGDAASALLAQCRARIAAVAPGKTDIAVHATPDAWSASPWLTVSGPVAGVDEYVVPAWDDADDDSAQRVHEVAATVVPRSVAAHVNVLDGSPETWRSRWKAVASAGAASLHLYHLGLVDSRRFDRLGECVAELQTPHPTGDTP